MARRLLLLSVVVVLVGLLAGCGGSGGGSDDSAASISINPLTKHVAPGETATFTAQVTGLSDSTVAWSVQEGSSGGSITADGVYTAPSEIGTYHVVAMCTSDPSKCASATVMVTTDVYVNVEPQMVTMDQGGTVTFQAVVGNTSVMDVTWSVAEGDEAGTITPDGQYTAPEKAGTYHVVATSVVDGDQTAEAVVTVPEVTISIMPDDITRAPGGTASFTATVENTVNTEVTWQVQEGDAGGSITDAGVYTAPAETGTYHVMATSVADPTKSATASIVVDDGIAVTIDPEQTLVAPNTRVNFSASVTGTSDTGVTWSVQEGVEGGTIKQNGEYNAPATTGTYHVVATSVANPLKKATATVQVDAVLLGDVREMQPGDEWEYEVTGHATPVNPPETKTYAVTGSYTMTVRDEFVSTEGVTCRVVLESASLLIDGVEEPIRAYANARFVYQDEEGKLWIYGGRYDAEEYSITSPSEHRYLLMTSPIVTGASWDNEVTQSNGLQFRQWFTIGGRATVDCGAAGVFESFTANSNGLFMGVPAVMSEWWVPSIGGPAQIEATFDEPTSPYKNQLTYRLTLKLVSRNR